MARRIFGFIIVLLTTFGTSRLSAQTEEHGRETIRGEMNFTELAEYCRLHPEPFRRNMLQNEEDGEPRPVNPPCTDSARIKMRIDDALRAFLPGPALPISPAPIDTFQSTYDPGTSIPPDTHGAVDSNYCMTTINTTVRIQTRAGALVSSVTLNAFWLTVLPGGGSFDPRVHYDPYTHRWIVVAVCGANSSTSSILIAISKTSNPTGAWWTYRVTAFPAGTYWFDYPDVGFNSKWITITGNLFENGGSAYGGAKVFVFNKANLLSGAGAPFTAFTRTSSFTICPALTYDPTQVNMFAIESRNSYAGQMELWKISGAVGSESLTSVAIPTSPRRWQGSDHAFSGTSGSDFAPQAGTSNLIQNNDDRVTQLVFMNNTLWFAHTVFLPYSTTANATRTGVDWWQLDTLGTPIQIGRIEDPTGVNYYAFPCMAVNTAEDALIGFSAFSATTFPSAAYAMRFHTDPVDSIRPLQIYRHGQARYYKVFSGTKNRWGDYSGCSLDPLNQLDFWTLQEASASPANNWDTWWAYVKICTPPGATITPSGPTAFCTGGSVSLDANTGTGYTYQWSLGGTPISGATNASYVTSTGGNYTVLVTSGACNSTSSVTTVTVSSPPSAIITPAGPTTFCTGGSVVLNASTGAGFSYQWQLGGGPILGATTSSYTATAAGNYSVLITNASGCSATSGLTTVTTNPSPTATATPGGPTTFCAGGSVLLTAGSGTGYTYQWQLGGTPVSGASLISYTATASGNYAVVVTRSGCSATSGTIAVTVNPAPPATVTPSGPTAFCSGGSVTLNASTGAGLSYQWRLGGTPISGATTSSFTASIGGNYTVFVTNSTGCTATSAITTVSVGTVPTATITPGGPTTFCTGGNVVLNGSTGTGYTYQWQLGGTPISGATNVSYTAFAAGNYTLVVSNSGCSATSAATTVTITPGPGSTITPAGPTTFCAGGSVILDANTGVGLSYQWLKDGVNISGATLASYTATTSGSYTVIVTFGSCVVSSAAVVVTAFPLVADPILGPIAVCAGQTITQTNATPGGTWASSNLLRATVSGLGVVTGVSAGTAIITYTSTTACGTTVATKTITINALPSVSAITGVFNGCIGATRTLASTTPAGTWSSSNPGIATVGSTSGIVTGMAAGTAVISYAVTNTNGCVGYSFTTYTVTTPLLAGITPSGPTTFCTGGSVVLRATTGIGLTYKWQLSGVDIPGATTANYLVNYNGSFAVVVNSGGGCLSTSSPVTVTVNPSPSVVPSVTILASPDTFLCITASPVTFSAIPVNGGTTPIFTWSVNDTVRFTGAPFIYTPRNGDVVKVKMNSSNLCSFPDTAIARTSVVVSAMRVPSVVISAAPGTTVCAGGNVVLTAVPTIGGSSPAYTWTKNGINVATGASYSYTPTDGDRVYCTMSSNAACVFPSTAVSATSILRTSPVVVNSIAITVSSSSIVAGQADTFTAYATNPGTSPMYQWYINGAPVPGATNAIFITTTLTNGMVVNCQVTSSNPCALPRSVFSTGITVAVDVTGIKAVSTTAALSLEPNPNTGTFTVKGTLKSTTDNRITIAVTNLLGQIVYTKNGTAHNGVVNERIVLPATLSSGMYLISIANNNYHTVFNMVLDK
jgi:hypothetical protein